MSEQVEMESGAEESKGSPAIKPEEFFYLKRQTEKLERELTAAREREAAARAQPDLSRELEETREQLRAAERKAARAAAILEAGLPAEVAELVPEGEPEQVAEYVEKAKRLAARLSGGGGTNTNPAGEAGGERGRLGQLAALARRGDERALREYAHLREEARS